jgi:UTP--glucose-1-phosphate uridylyltransferase
MQAAGLPDVVIRTFAHYHAQLAAGETGLIPESTIEPVDDLPHRDQLGEDVADLGREALPRTILLKLNGGLGTSMGLDRAKSLLTVKDGHTFLDIIAGQARHAGVPLVLMNSFATREDSLAALAAHGDLPGDLPPDFLQHKVPKIRREDLQPATCERDPALAWCPPGHGDLYTALVTSGMLATLLERGYRYAFVSNADNLGAVIDPAILGHMVAHRLPFLMEVAPRTAADRKGGHLARRPDGQLVLRELAQCPEEDEAAFQDITRHRFFNTNSLWLDLHALDRLLRERDGVLGLPMIRNAKTVDPRDPDSTPVYQLETAMGSAIGVFAGAGAICVPPARFAPIKKTNDLLDVRSDSYVLTDAWEVLPSPARTLGRAVIDLDPAFYRFVDDLDARFPAGPPSLLRCARLEVRGDIRFGAGVVLEGEVVMRNQTGAQVTVPDGAVIAGEWTR